ncbi:hypothetical protein D9M70_639270 [compost metagenome]
MGVNRPPYIPPRMMTGSIRASVASRKATSTPLVQSFRLSARTSSKPLMLAITQTVRISDTAIRSPGRIPAMNSAPTDTLAVSA